MRSGVEVCLYLSIAGPAFPCRAPREKIEGDDGTGRGGSPTLRCYQEQETGGGGAGGGKGGGRGKGEGGALTFVELFGHGRREGEGDSSL